MRPTHCCCTSDDSKSGAFEEAAAAVVDDDEGCNIDEATIAGASAGVGDRGASTTALGVSLGFRALGGARRGTGRMAGDVAGWTDIDLSR